MKTAFLINVFSYSGPNIAVKCRRVHLTILQAYCLSLFRFFKIFFFILFYYLFFCKTMWKHLRTCVRLATRLKTQPPVYHLKVWFEILLWENETYTHTQSFHLILFRSLVVVFHLRWPMAFLSFSLYDTPGLAPHMNVLLWRPDSFPVIYSNRDTSWNAWNRHSGSFEVYTRILFSNLKSPSRMHTLYMYVPVYQSDGRDSNMTDMQIRENWLFSPYMLKVYLFFNQGA